MNNQKKVNLSGNFKEKIEPRSQFQKKSIPGVKKILAISSAKGGVGKSTMSANIAVALAKQNLNIGLLDADVYGPSIPELFNIYLKPSINEEKKIEPLIAQKVKLISMGFLIDRESPVVWRGPMVISALKTFLNNVSWGQLDYLVIDLPPGTGDAILTITQQVKIDKSIIVTTPQKLSISDTIRGIEMFRKTETPILGIIENMSYFELNNIKKYPFGKNLIEEIAIANNKVEVLCQIPLDDSFDKSAKSGIVFDDLSEISKEKILQITNKIINE